MEGHLMRLEGVVCWLENVSIYVLWRSRDRTAYDFVFGRHAIYRSICGVSYKSAIRSEGLLDDGNNQA